MCLWGFKRKNNPVSRILTRDFHFSEIISNGIIDCATQSKHIYEYKVHTQPCDYRSKFFIGEHLIISVPSYDKK